MIFKIQPIATKETLPLRHKVLWPDHPMERSKVEGDEAASHYGGYLDGTLICVASLFQVGDGMRLRKFATDPAFQGQGFGTQMLNHLLKEAKTTGVNVFWFDARESALPFYARHGYQPDGERFYNSGVPYFRVSKSL